MTRRLLTLRLGAIAAVAAVALASIGQFVWPQTIAGISGQVLNALRGLHDVSWVGVVIVLCMVTISGVLPASLVGIAAGAAYGVTLGFATASISVLTGAVVAFLFSRSLLRPLIESKFADKPRLSSLDGHIGNRGWRFVCLLRLSPIMPFAATSYALGLSSIRLGAYLVGTLASLPSLLVYVLAGTVVKTGVSAWNGRENSIRIALLALGTLSMAIVVIEVVGVLRRADPALAATVPGRAEVRILRYLAVCTRALWYPLHRSAGPRKEATCDATGDTPELPAERNRRG